MLCLLFHGWKVRNDRREQGVAMRDFLEHTLQSERARCEQVVASMETSATREAQKKEEEFQERLDTPEYRICLSQEDYYSKTE